MVCLEFFGSFVFFEKGVEGSDFSFLYGIFAYCTESGVSSGIQASTVGAEEGLQSDMVLGHMVDS